MTLRVMRPLPQPEACVRDEHDWESQDRDCNLGRAYETNEVGNLRTASSTRGVRTRRTQGSMRHAPCCVPQPVVASVAHLSHSGVGASMPEHEFAQNIMQGPLHTHSV